MQRKMATLTVLKKEERNAVQQENIKASALLSGLLKTCIGPKAMAKMILTRIGGIELTSDGNAILREMEVAHPAIKSLVELSRTQNEEVGDGTTSVVFLASEILQSVSPLLSNNEGMHPISICFGLKKALDFLLEKLKKHSLDISAVKKERGTTQEEAEKQIIRESMGTKMSKYLIDLAEISHRAVQVVRVKEGGRTTHSIRTRIKVEKVPGGRTEETELLEGVLLQKDVLDTSMPQTLTNPKILLIDFPLEYRKGENQMHIEMHSSETFSRALEVEEQQIEKMVAAIAAVSPSLLISEKGVSDHAISLLSSRGVSAIRRVKKSDNQRISLATGAKIVSRPEDLSSRSLGVAGIFERISIGDSEYCRISQCAAPKACTVLLRGPSKDVLNDLERALHTGFSAARNLSQSPLLVPGGGAIEMALAAELERAEGISPDERRVFKCVSAALQCIPGALVSNSGNPSHSIKKLIELRHRHAHNPSRSGVDGNTGEVCDARIYESVLVKEQMLKSAIEGAVLVLRVDGVVRQ